MLAEDVQAQGNYLYMVTQDTLEMASISNPGSPTYTGSVLLPAGDIYEWLSVDGQFAYVAGFTTAIQSVQAWPPDSPSVVGPVDPLDTYLAYGVLASNGFLYAGSASFGVRIYKLY